MKASAGRGILAALVCGLAAFVGCSKEQAPPTLGTIYGKVTVAGQPLTGGNLLLRSSDGRVSSAPISANGSYEANIPVGEAKVGVDTETLKKLLEQKERNPNYPRQFTPNDIAKMKDKKPNPTEAPDPYQGMSYVPIPEKYRDPQKSALSVTVTEGKQQKDISLD